VGNVIWLILVGWWLALGHLVTAIGLAITIIGPSARWRPALTLTRQAHAD
jgi:uncharacterized membrane protein YccF (DUF307 family)